MTYHKKSSQILRQESLCVTITGNNLRPETKGTQKQLRHLVRSEMQDVHASQNQASAVQSDEKKHKMRNDASILEDSFWRNLELPNKMAKCESIGTALCQKFDLLVLETTSLNLATLLGEHIDVKVEDVLDLFNYFIEVILDQMVPYDSFQSPYRKYLLAKAPKSTALLATVASISAGHLYERNLISRKVAVAFNDLSTVFANQSYENLKGQIKNGHDFIDDAKVLDNCLNLLLQLSRSIFCCGISRIARYSSLRGYITIVNDIIVDLRKKAAFEFEKTEEGENGFLWFLLQRLIFNDIFFSFLNDSQPIVDIELIKHASLFEKMHILKENKTLNKDHFPISKSIEITGCPMSLLEIMHQIQRKAFMLLELEELARKGDDESLEITIVKKRATYVKYFREQSQYIHESYKQKLISCKCIDENEVPGFVSLLKIFFLTANILNLKYIAKDTPNSLEMIVNVHELLEVVSKEIDVGSGPDTCVAFPVFIAARESFLKSHRDSVLNFMDLSCWHLNLGGQRMAKKMLCDFYWKGEGNQAKRDLTESYLLLY